MFLDINKIGAEGFSFNENLHLDDLRGAGNLINVLRASLQGRVRRGGRGMHLFGHLDAAVVVRCSRCTEPVELDLDRDFFLALVPDAAEFATGEVQMDRKDADLYYTSGGRADLEVIAAEQIYLNLPLKPVCREDCQGLCPHCGANRNVTDCGCSDVTPDPRLAPLLEFRKRRAH